MRVVSALAVTALSLARAEAVHAAEAEWPQFRGDPRLTGISRGALPTDLATVWTFEAPGGVESSPAISRGTVYFGALSGTFYALRLDTGAVKWKYEAGDAIKSSPAVFSGTVYFGDEKGTLHAVDATTGSRRWVFETGAAIASPPNLVADVLIFGSNDNNLYGLSPRTGAVLWKVETGGYVYGSPALADGFDTPAVVSAGCDGFLRVVRARDGKVLRKIELGAYVGASPAVAGGRAYVGTFENQVVGVDLQNSRVLWTYEHPERKFPFYSSAALDGDFLVVGGRDRMVHALQAGTGKEIWAYSARAKVDASPILFPDRVLVATTGGDVVALSRAGGEVLWQFEAATPILASPSFAGGRLVVATTGGLIYCFGGK